MDIPIFDQNQSASSSSSLSIFPISFLYRKQREIISCHLYHIPCRDGGANAENTDENEKQAVYKTLQT